MQNFSIFQPEDFQNEYIQARQNFIRRQFSSLNDAQQEAVLATEGPVLLLAGAGSGKTTVLINRIQNLLIFGKGYESDFVPDNATKEDIAIFNANDFKNGKRRAAVSPVNPKNILAITFTKKAATELQNRLEEKVGAAAKDITACTFHSLGLRILRRNAQLVGYKNDFKVYDKTVSEKVLRNIYDELGLAYNTDTIKEVAKIIEKCKRELISPKAYYENLIKTGNSNHMVHAEIYTKYAHRMKEENAMDYEDLILFSFIALYNYDNARSFWQSKFKYVLVDEFQDTNKLQYGLVSLLTKKHRNLFAVGDDDQCIYKFRGATIQNVISFEDEFSDARVLRLEQNYRSPRNIIEAANAIIANNTVRREKELWTDREYGEKITLHYCDDEEAEAEFIADKIIESHEAGRQWKGHTILYRMNALSRQIETTLGKYNIPYVVYGGTRFYDREEIKDMVAYLSVIDNTNNDDDLLRIINKPTRGIGNTSINAAKLIAEENNMSLFSVIRQAKKYSQIHAGQAMENFAKLIMRLQRFSNKETPMKFYERLLKESTYIEALRKKNEKEPDSNITTKIENVKELKSSIVSYYKVNGTLDIHEFVSEIKSYYTDKSHIDTGDGARKDCVALMSIHAAKGLEFPIVFLAGAEENILPCQRMSGSKEDVEEERRLCYVAVTRTMEKLYISHTAERLLFGSTHENDVSRFVDEIPGRYIEMSGVESKKNHKPARSELRGIPAPRPNSLPAPVSNSKPLGNELPRIPSPAPDKSENVADIVPISATRGFKRTSENETGLFNSKKTPAKILQFHALQQQKQSENREVDVQEKTDNELLPVAPDSPTQNIVPSENKPQEDSKEPIEIPEVCFSKIGKADINSGLYMPGSYIIHSAFGRGIIYHIRPTGTLDDLIISVNFENTGTKDLLLSAALKFMQVSSASG